MPSGYVGSNQCAYTGFVAGGAKTKKCVLGGGVKTENCYNGGNNTTHYKNMSSSI